MSEVDLNNSTPLLSQKTRAELLGKWFEAQNNSKYWKDYEMSLRKQIFAGTFLEPVEGSKNEFDLEDGYILKAEHKLNRSIDEGALGALVEKLRDMKVNTDTLIRYKPELAITVYKTLTEEQRNLFDQCLVIKEGSPSMKIIPNKKAK